jgi:hypothetical protein
MSPDNGVIADTTIMTLFFPKPDLNPFERIEWKAKAQLMSETGRRTAGFLYLTNRHVLFVPGRGTQRGNDRVQRFARSECIDVISEEGTTALGRGAAFWNRMRLSFAGTQSILVAVKRGDHNADLLRQQLTRVAAH